MHTVKTHTNRKKNKDGYKMEKAKVKEMNVGEKVNLILAKLACIS